MTTITSTTITAFSMMSLFLWQSDFALGVFAEYQVRSVASHVRPDRQSKADLQ